MFLRMIWAFYPKNFIALSFRRIYNGKQWDKALLSISIGVVPLHEQFAMEIRRYGILKDSDSLLHNHEVRQAWTRMRKHIRTISQLMIETE